MKNFRIAVVGLQRDVQEPIVAVERDNILALAFHPELGTDLRIHKYFLGKCQK